MTILYIETNFLMSIAEGRDPAAETLLALTSPPFRIAMPSVRYLEGLWCLENLRKQFNTFDNEMSSRIKDWGRDATSPHAVPLLEHLARSRVKAGDRFNDVEVRFFRALLALSGRIEAIEPGPVVLEACVRNRSVMKDLTDALILHCIASHATSSPGEDRFLLTGDTHFKMDDAEKIWREAGVGACFSEARQFLGRLGFLPLGDPQAGSPV